jgi:uncharacterized membrane protein YkvA (DUF1232 family)
MARDKDRKRGRGGRGRGAATITRALSLMAFLPVASRAPLYARFILALALDERTPASRKALLLGAVGYLLVGRDLVPDAVPVIGGLDDLVIVVVAVDLFLEGLPQELIDEKLDELGIDRAAFEQDVAQIRRLTPGPVRRTIRRVPQLIGTAGDALQRSGLGPRVRAWITREDPIA